MACRSAPSPKAILINGRSNKSAAAIVAALGVDNLDWAGLLSEPCRTARMDRTRDGRGNPPCRPGRQRLDHGADRLRIGAFRNPGRTRYRICKVGRGQRRSGLHPRADCWHTRRFHRRACAPGVASRCAKQRTGTRSAHLSGGISRLRIFGGDDMTGLWQSYQFYLWVKAFHVIAMIAWMAGMLYLPRLFVYHCETKPGSAELRALQGDGAQASASDHDSGDGRGVDFRPDAIVPARDRCLASRLVSYEIRARYRL